MIIVISLKRKGKEKVKKMNKQELENNYTELLKKYPFGKVEIKQVLKDLDKLDEPKKVTIPQFVADWIKYCKLTSVDLYHAFEMSDLYLGNYAYQKDYPKLKGYFESENNQEIFARAWLDGYKVEENRYLVKMKGLSENDCYLRLGRNTNLWWFGMKYNDGSAEHTRKDLEQAGFGWVFDCPGVVIEEVEE